MLALPEQQLKKVAFYTGPGLTRTLTTRHKGIRQASGECLQSDYQFMKTDLRSHFHQVLSDLEES